MIYFTLACGICVASFFFLVGWWWDGGTSMGASSAEDVGTAAKVKMQENREECASINSARSRLRRRFVKLRRQCCDGRNRKAELIQRRLDYQSIKLSCLNM